MSNDWTINPYAVLRPGAYVLVFGAFAAAAGARRFRLWRLGRRYRRYQGPRYVRKPRLSEIKQRRRR